MTQKELQRVLRSALITDWDKAISTSARAAIITFCARDVREHVPLSTVQNILPKLCETKRMLQNDLVALRSTIDGIDDIDDLVRLMVNEIINVRLDLMKVTDIDDYDNEGGL